MSNRTHIDLFSGIGGFALAARWAGIKTVQFVEIEPFCQKVLNKNFPGVPIHDDITTFNGTKYSNVFLLTGGFPCQPFSCAGKRMGAEDDRALWPEMLRVIQEVRPYWIVGENVAGIIGMELDNYISDLEREGYTIQAFVIPACAVNAPHRRDRVWIVAHKSGEGLQGKQQRPGEGLGCGLELCSQSDCATPYSIGGGTGGECEPSCDQRRRTGEGWRESIRQGNGKISASGNGNGSNGHGWSEPWIEAATRLCRVDDGLPRKLDRVNRLKALGNAVVPQIPYLIMKAIMDIKI
jgi:DNA (cytosine-5)-methyltransferase 1